MLESISYAIRGLAVERVMSSIACCPISGIALVEAATSTPLKGRMLRFTFWRACNEGLSHHRSDRPDALSVPRWPHWLDLGDYRLDPAAQVSGTKTPFC